MSPDRIIPRLDPVEFRRRLDDGEPLAVLDVREDDERAYCAIALPATAADLHVPLGAVPARLDEIRARRRAGRWWSTAITASARCTPPRWLSARGVAGAANLDGGIDAWSRAVDPGVPRY